MPTKVEQTIRFGENILHLELLENGAIIITCTNNVKLRFPYEREGNEVKFISDAEGTDDFLEVEVSPNGTWDF